MGNRHRKSDRKRAAKRLIAPARVHDREATHAAFEYAALSELQTDVRAALDVLPSRDRLVIELLHGVCSRYRDAYATDEVAEFLGVDRMRVLNVYEAVLYELSKVSYLQEHI